MADESFKRGKPIHSQARQIIWNVHSFFQADEHLSNNDVLLKTAQATGVSRTTVRTIVREGKCELHDGDLSLNTDSLGLPEGPSTSTPFRSPGKKRPRRAEKTDLDDFDLSVIRATVAEIHREGKYPTVASVLLRVREKIAYDGGETSLRLVMKKMGFKYGKIDSRKFLIERPEIVTLRRQYLRSIKQFRREGRNIVVLDETWVNENCGKDVQWHDMNTVPGHKIPLGKGRRLILCHAGSIDGFVQGGLLLFRSRTSSENYHDEMNGATFLQWFKEQLLPNIAPNSVIVMDNAPYHSVLKEKLPTTASRKGEMMEWLNKHGIPFEADLLKKELYDIVKIHKAGKKEYVIDNVAAEHGHTVLRLPPYHCDLNPIELIWAQVKGSVRNENTTFKLADVEALTKVVIKRITANDWKKCFEHVLKVEAEYWMADPIVEERVEPLIINTAGSDSDSE